VNALVIFWVSGGTSAARSVSGTRPNCRSPVSLVSMDGRSRNGKEGASRKATFLSRDIARTLPPIRSTQMGTRKGYESDEYEDDEMGVRWQRTSTDQTDDSYSGRKVVVKEVSLPTQVSLKISRTRTSTQHSPLCHHCPLRLSRRRKAHLSTPIDPRPVPSCYCTFAFSSHCIVALPSWFLVVFVLVFKQSLITLPGIFAVDQQR
jgi:hypothetical protein